MTDSLPKEKNYTRAITVISILLPIAVAALFFVKIDGYNTSFLPPIYAVINAITSVILVLALFAIKKKNIVLHKRLMTTAIVLSLLFLLAYVIYHATSATTRYGGEGIALYIYFFLLLTHIVLSIAIIPMVMISFTRGLSAKYDKHRKIAKITFPLWLYVTITGVICYIMISPYY